MLIVDCALQDSRLSAAVQNIVSVERLHTTREHEDLAMWRKCGSTCGVESKIHVKREVSRYTKYPALVYDRPGQCSRYRRLLHAVLLSASLLPIFLLQHQAIAARRRDVLC